MMPPCVMPHTHTHTASTHTSLQFAPTPAAHQVNEFVKRVRAAKIHFLIIGHLRKQMPYFGGWPGPWGRRFHGCVYVCVSVSVCRQFRFLTIGHLHEQMPFFGGWPGPWGGVWGLQESAARSSTPHLPLTHPSRPSSLQARKKRRRSCWRTCSRSSSRCSASTTSTQVSFCTPLSWGAVRRMRV